MQPRKEGPDLDRVASEANAEQAAKEALHTEILRYINGSESIVAEFRGAGERVQYEGHNFLVPHFLRFLAIIVKNSGYPLTNTAYSTSRNVQAISLLGSSVVIVAALTKQPTGVGWRLLLLQDIAVDEAHCNYLEEFVNSILPHVATKNFDKVPEALTAFFTGRTNTV